VQRTLCKDIVEHVKTASNTIAIWTGTNSVICIGGRNTMIDDKQNKQNNSDQNTMQEFAEDAEENSAISALPTAR
jgi:hypothetical protein